MLFIKEVFFINQVFIGVLVNFITSSINLIIIFI